MYPEHLIEVPPDALSEAALRGVIESYVLREGTDYGDQIFSLEQKVAQVRLQLVNREIVLIFDTKEESFDIRRKMP